RLAAAAHCVGHLRPKWSCTLFVAVREVRHVADDCACRPSRPRGASGAFARSLPTSFGSQHNSYPPSYRRDGCSSAPSILHEIGTCFGIALMRKAPTPTVEAPRTEPEIIPPGANSHSASRIWVSDGGNHTVHLQVARVGAVGMVLLALLIGVVGVTGLFFLLG